MRPGEIQSDFAYLPDVSVTCSTSDLVVRVKPAFYGLGADADELKLGNTCKITGVLRPYGDLLFTYPLTACDAVRQSPRDYLVYKFVLHYEPSPKRFPSRAQPIDVHIECRYPRNHHVYQLTVKPTWQTVVMRKGLKGRPNDFQIDLMDDSWSKPAEPQVYHLGKTVNFQVSAPHLPTNRKLYINSCYATPASGSKPSLKYIIVDNFGCMLDSKRDPGASQFISRTDKGLRFSLKAFQFTSDPDTEVRIYCNLSFTSEDPSPAHKSCTYRGNRWKALTGDDSICECCDSQCVTSKPRRAMMEGHASSGLLLVSDQPYAAEDGFLPISPHSSISMSREGETTISDYTGLHSHENQWGSPHVVMMYGDDEEEEVYTTEEEEQLDEDESRVREELGFRESVWELNQFEEGGSGYIVQEDYSEGEEEIEELEEGKDETSDVQQVDQKEGEVLEQMLPSDVSLQRELVSEEEEENRKHTVRGEEDDRSIASEEKWKNDEMTWYFTWL
ncbi:Zona pellucida sperm-binding protein 3 [Collichthys lucidus]|uniref:Zona pellucida sperm-binding protein 3 n=1 Tax=Collichthys lucidus TaxID=240159 RepID=A0A4U5VEZ3_COLLU|nr:Zona pellucida sperm-binding protein 3 [Collichthys lucidus]